MRRSWTRLSFAVALCSVTSPLIARAQGAEDRDGSAEVTPPEEPPADAGSPGGTKAGAQPAPPEVAGRSSEFPELSREDEGKPEAAEYNALRLRGFIALAKMQAAIDRVTDSRRKEDTHLRSFEQGHKGIQLVIAELRKLPNLAPVSDQLADAFRDRSTSLERPWADALAAAALSGDSALETKHEPKAPPGSPTLQKALKKAREERCRFAICWAGTGGTKYALEPIVDLPVGLVFAVGNGSLSSFINGNKLNIEFNAGARLWLWYDAISLMLYYAAPVGGSDDTIRVPGSEFEHPASSVRRPFPTVGIGLFGDLIQFGFGVDQLVNGDEGAGDPKYAPNEVISRSLTITMGFSTFLSARTLGAALSKDDDEPSKQDPPEGDK